MLRALHRYVVRRKFQRMVADFDRRIAEARAKHQPVAAILKAKQRFVHEKLGLGRS